MNKTKKRIITLPKNETQRIILMCTLLDLKVQDIKHLTTERLEDECIRLGFFEKEEYKN